MFSLKKQDKRDPQYLNQLTALLHLIRAHPIRTENFLDSFHHFVKIFNAQSASLYLYEKKTNMFVLKKWSGTKPNRFSISGDYEFINQLKLRAATIHRSEFSKKSANEFRQAALFYFQNTLSTVCCPLIEQGEWFGMMNINVIALNHEDEFILESFLEIYADALKKWIQYQEMTQQNKKLSEVSHVKNQLLANVTHELQTPLNGILGIASALLDNENLDSETKHSIQLIKKSGDELHKTVNNILELVQIEAKKDKQQKERIQILNLIKEVVLLYDDACQKKGVQLIIPKSEGEVLVYAHPDQIRTVLMNLIGNAVKFTKKGEIKVEIQKSGENLHISIADTGIGIDDDKLGLIFEEFFQADGSHTRVYGGTGLGLAIVKKIITLHGGRIWVDSQIGVGTCFHFTLPVYPV